ncbi:ATP-binding protein [Mastigocoleus testarum]
MLTRDIELQDAILDLLDNCVDGIQRTIRDTQQFEDSEEPYRKFWAKINFSSDNFTIADNCGGIPIDTAKKYAFRMGRPDNNFDNDVYTIGTYGIGMKRSIFKMGRSSEVVSQTESIQALAGHTNTVWSVAFARDDSILVSGSLDETIKIWDIKTGECLKTLRYRPYERMNITGVKGLTSAEILSLKALGAIEKTR